jgi:hypothetical protein
MKIMTSFHRVFVWRDAAIRHDGSFPRILRPVPFSRFDHFQPIISAIPSARVYHDFITCGQPTGRHAQLYRSSTRDQLPARRI